MPQGILFTTPSTLALLILCSAGAYANQSEHTPAPPPAAELQPSQKDWRGALIEAGSVLALGRIAYEVGDSMERDFDYEITGGTFSYFHDRLFTTEYWKLDDNSQTMNWGHAYAGAVYHQAFRNNHFNYYESALAALAVSTVWEAFIEYKEVVSINDQIYTTWGGAVLGESLFQIQQLLETKPGWVPAALSALFNPTKAINNWWFEHPRSPLLRPVSEDVFSLYAGVLHSQHRQRDLNATSLVLGMQASVNQLGQRKSGFTSQPSFVELDIEAGFSSAGFEDFQLNSKVLLGGYYHAASKTYIGPSLGLEYNSFGSDELTEDFYSAAHLIGIDAGTVWQGQQWSLYLRTSAYGDFAMVKPFASQGTRNYRVFYWNSKSALWENAYAYALGHTIDVQMGLRWQDLTLEAQFVSQYWDSIDHKKYERSGQWNPNRRDLDFKDSRERLCMTLNYRYSSALMITAQWERIRREGDFYGIDEPWFSAHAKDTETRTSLTLNYHY